MGDDGWDRASARAAVYTSGPLSTQLGQPVADPGKDFPTYIAHQAHTAVTVQRGDEPPPDTHLRAQRQVVVTYRPIGRDGWTGVGLTVEVYCTLARQHGRWSVVAQRVQT